MNVDRAEMQAGLLSECYLNVEKTDDQKRKWLFVTDDSVFDVGFVTMSYLR